MGKLGLLTAATISILVLVGGVALAVTKQCDARCAGKEGNDTLLGTRGGNDLAGRGGNDTLKGFESFDQLMGEVGNDELFGGKGGDALYPGPGTDVVRGGEGSDIYHFQADFGRDVAVDTPTTGTARPNLVVVRRAITSDMVINLNSSANASEIRNTTGTLAVNWSDNVMGDAYSESAGADVVRGNGANNQLISKNNGDDLYGGGGDDRISVYDRDGKDTVNCGENADGSADNDTVFYNTGDIVINCEDLREDTDPF